MASNYSSLKIQLMATGENSGTWGDVTNTNLGTALEEAIVGSADVTFASANVTLTLTDTNATQTARNLRLNLIGTTGANRDLIVPAIEKVYIINNGCAHTVTVKNSTGSGIGVPAGKTMYVYNNGTNVVDAITHLSSLTLGSALPIASGGTGSTSTTYANLQSNVFGVLPVANGGTGSSTATFSGANITSLNASNISAGTLAVGRGGTGLTSVGTSGNVLTSNGTAWVSQAAAAGGGDYVMTTFTSPGTWTKPAGLKAVKVTVIGGGGGGGGAGPFGCGGGVASGGAGGGVAVEYLDAPAIPGPVSVTVGSGGTAGPAPGSFFSTGGTGGTTSFGPFLSATGGGGGTVSPPTTPKTGTAGDGSGGTYNARGSNSNRNINVQNSAAVGPGGSAEYAGGGGNPIFVYNGGVTAGAIPGAGTAATGYGCGGGGGSSLPGNPVAGGAGSAGYVIVEEFY